jgi:hypothetical protein
MKKEGRLQSARAWIAKYEGKNIVKGYSNWYGVDLLCAIKELRILGINIDEERERQVKATFEGRARARQRKKLLQEQEKSERVYFDSDDTFAFIAGYTSDGFRYGVTWEEAGSENTNEPESD